MGHGYGYGYLWAWALHGAGDDFHRIFTIYYYYSLSLIVDVDVDVGCTRDTLAITSFPFFYFFVLFGGFTLFLSFLTYHLFTLLFTILLPLQGYYLLISNEFWISLWCVSSSLLSQIFFVMYGTEINYSLIRMCPPSPRELVSLSQGLVSQDY